MEGMCPKVSALYPDVQFPVSRETPTTADLASFCHTETFFTNSDSILVSSNKGTATGVTGNYYLRIFYHLQLGSRILEIIIPDMLESKRTSIRYSPPLTKG